MSGTKVVSVAGKVDMQCVGQMRMIGYVDGKISPMQ